jgi:hypothetical protein
MTQRRSRRGAWAGLVTVGSLGVAAYLTAIRPWHRRWGATDAEAEGEMPGDELVPQANFQTTRAINIDAPAEAVWPWLVQIGQGRGGFYSYDLLENMMGLDINSSGQIVPEWQDLKVGDVVPLEPEGGGYTVAELVPNRHLVLFTDGSGQSEMEQVFRQASAVSTWAFVLHDLEGARSRLVVRWKARWDHFSSATNLLIGLALDPIEFIMEQKMMRGIKERAEAAIRDRARASP